jgi:hypothetical protein
MIIFEAKAEKPNALQISSAVRCPMSAAWSVTSSTAEASKDAHTAPCTTMSLMNGTDF